MKKRDILIKQHKKGLIWYKNVNPYKTKRTRKCVPFLYFTYLFNQINVGLSKAKLNNQIY